MKTHQLCYIHIYNNSTISSHTHLPAPYFPLLLPLGPLFPFACELHCSQKRASAVYIYTVSWLAQRCHFSPIFLESIIHIHTYQSPQSFPHNNHTHIIAITLEFIHLSSSPLMVEQANLSSLCMRQLPQASQKDHPILVLLCKPGSSRQWYVMHFPMHYYMLHELNKPVACVNSGIDMIYCL